jgi:hypothetical protein
MRARAIAIALVLIAVAGCRSHERSTGNPASLRLLEHVSFDHTNFGVILDAKTGKPLSAFRVNNPIRAAIPDGDGGWYIGGGFIRVNGALRKRLAHIDADGRLDPDWRPEANGNGVSVTSIARIGPRLYVAGDFAQLNHASRLHLGALDVESGKLDKQWRPSARRPVWNSVVLAAGNRLIVGGGSCCSEAGSSVAALDPETGALDRSWHPDVDAESLEGGGVDLLVSNGSGILVSGRFRSVNGVRRAAVAEVDSRSGALVRRWRPRIGRGYCPWCSLFSAAVGQNRVYGSINGPARNELVAFGRRTGRSDPRWHGRIAATTGLYGGTSAYALAFAGGRVYAAGDFDRINGVRRNGFAALDPATARVLPAWQPHANWVYGTLLATSGDRLLLGVQLARALRFDFAGLKTYRPVRRLRLLLALSGPGTVSISLGRGCDIERWTESARCEGRVFRRLAVVRFTRAARRRYDRRLHVPAGAYFVHFVPRTLRGEPTAPYDFPIIVR